MRVLQLFIEITFIGSLAILGFNNLISLPTLLFDDLTQTHISFSFDFIVLAWLFGFFINILSELFLAPFARWVENRWMLRNGNPVLVLERLRYDLYAKCSSKDLIQRIEYHRSLIRLSRCIVSGTFLYFILAIILSHYFQVLIAFIIILFAAFAYYRALIWSVKSIYYSWISIKKNSDSLSQIAFQMSPNLPPQVSLAKINTHDPSLGISIVAFTGGTGFRDINMALAQKTQNITRVVPIWDNGGSSKALRENFSLMPVGDIRHAIMTQAHGEGRVGSMVKLFNWRLSNTGDNKKLLNELQGFVNNEHPLMQSLDPSLGNVIVNYLKHFYDSLMSDSSSLEVSGLEDTDIMDLKNGSIGNFVLVGSYFAHNKDINTAIYVFRQLCSIKGNVWPISKANDLHIVAHLDNGHTLSGQSNVTMINRLDIQSRIKYISFSDNLALNSPSLTISANPMVLDALEKAEVIVFGPGSFFTSVLPHIKVDGIADALSKRDVPKVFIGNLLEDNECYGYSLEEIMDIFIKTCNQHATIKRPANKYITHIIAHSSHTMGEYTHNNKRYLPLGNNIERFNHDGISIIINDFENPWKRGGHDPVCISEYLLNITHT